MSANLRASSARVASNSARVASNSANFRTTINRVHDRLKVYEAQNSEDISAQQALLAETIQQGNRCFATVLDISGSTGMGTVDKDGREITVLRKEIGALYEQAKFLHDKFSQYGRVHIFAYTFAINSKYVGLYTFDASGNLSNDPYAGVDSTGATFLHKGLDMIRADFAPDGRHGANFNPVQCDAIIATDGVHSEEDDILETAVNRLKAANIGINIIAISRRDIDFETGVGVFSINTLAVSNSGGTILTPDGKSHIVGVQKETIANSTFQFAKTEYPATMKKFVLSQFSNVGTLRSILDDDAISSPEKVQFLMELSKHLYDEEGMTTATKDAFALLRTHGNEQFYEAFTDAQSESVAILAGAAAGISSSARKDQFAEAARLNYRFGTLRPDQEGILFCGGLFSPKNVVFQTHNKDAKTVVVSDFINNKGARVVTKITYDEDRNFIIGIPDESLSTIAIDNQALRQNVRAVLAEHYKREVPNQMNNICANIAIAAILVYIIINSDVDVDDSKIVKLRNLARAQLGQNIPIQDAKAEGGIKYGETFLECYLLGQLPSSHGVSHTSGFKNKTLRHATCAESMEEFMMAISFAIGRDAFYAMLPNYAEHLYSLFGKDCVDSPEFYEFYLQYLRTKRTTTVGLYDDHCEYCPITLEKYSTDSEVGCLTCDENGCRTIISRETYDLLRGQRCLICHSRVPNRPFDDAVERIELCIAPKEIFRHEVSDGKMQVPAPAPVVSVPAPVVQVQVPVQVPVVQVPVQVPVVQVPVVQVPVQVPVVQAPVQDPVRRLLDGDVCDALGTLFGELSF
jgi:hypothetical protein